MNIEFCNSQSEVGFIYVASCDKLYYELALISCQSLKDYYPDSHVTLFTHKEFLDNRAEIFDQVITGIPIHNRAKMWCMARTPYKKTLYNDCDSLIRHRDVKKIHDFLEDSDMFFGSQLEYTVSNYKWAFIDKACTIKSKYHGSLCGYVSSEIVLQFMQDWFDEYNKQQNSEWNYTEYYKEWKQFDMFTLWRMTSGLFPEFDNYKQLNIKIIPRRYNNTCCEIPQEFEGNPVITQISRSTWPKMTTVWNNITMELQNAPNKIKTKSNNKISIEYN